jgi:hypothetical protein
MSIDLDALISRSDPLWDHEVPDGSSSAGHRLYEEVLTKCVLESARPRTPRRVPVAIGGAAAAAVLAAVLLIVSQTAPTVSAAAELTHIAHIVAAQEPPTLASGQSLYSQRTATIEMTFTSVNGIAAPAVHANFPISIETWAQSNGDVAYREHFGAAQFTSPAAREAWLAAGLPEQFEQKYMGQGSTVLGTEGTQSAALDVAGLPVDATTLGSLIDQGNTGIPEIDRVSPGPDATGERITLLLLGPDVGATPRFYSALYQVLSTVPGVKKLGTLTTHSGKTGTGFGLQLAGQRSDQERLIVDPTTGTLLEAQNVALGPLGVQSQSTSLYALSLTFEILDRIAEPRTLGSAIPPFALWIAARTTDRVVSDSTLPSGIAPPGST